MARSRSVRAQALVEFAMVLPLILLLLVGILDFGRAVYASHTIGNAARQAARAAIVDQNESAVFASAESNAVGLAIRVDASYWSPTPNVNPLLNTECTTVVRQCIAVVTVETDFQAVTPIIGAIVGPMTLEVVTEMPVERAYSSP